MIAKSGMLDMYSKAKENYSGKLMSPEAISFMSETTVDRPPSLVPEPATPADRSTGLPPRPEMNIEKSREFIVEDELLGGVFSPGFSAKPESADFLTGKVHSLDQEKETIKPFLRWLIAGRVNNPYLILSDSDRPTGREADPLGTDEVKDPQIGIDDPRRAVKIKAQEGVSFIRGVKAVPGGERSVERMFQILKQGKISNPSQLAQRIEDIRLLHQLDTALGFSKMMFQSFHSEDKDGAYNFVPSGSESGRKYREGTANIVDELVKQEIKDPEKSLIDYEVLDEGEGLDRKVRVIRRVRLPLGVKKPRPGYEYKRIDLALAKEGLSAEEKEGYEILALAAHYLTDPLIRTAIETTYRLDDPLVKVMGAKERAKSPGTIQVIVERIRNAFLNDIP